MQGVAPDSRGRESFKEDRRTTEVELGADPRISSMKGIGGPDTEVQRWRQSTRRALTGVSMCSVMEGKGAMRRASGRVGAETAVQGWEK